MKGLSLLLALLVFSLPALAQETRLVDDAEWCEDSWGQSDRDTESYCEVREITLPAGRDLIRIDGGQNGGIKVEGWDRDEIRVRAKVVAYGRTETAAREIAADIRLDTDGRIHADLPDVGRKEWAYVSFRVHVPHRSNLDLEARNGGIHIEGVAGDIDFETQNGGVGLIDLAGDVQGRTTNGGVRIDLTGAAWQGEGLDVKTTNGGVKITLPEEYSAELETRTTNGRLRVDFPVTVVGDIGRKLTTTLGRGGKTIRAITTNGGVKIVKEG